MVGVWDSKPRKEARMQLLYQVVSWLVPAVCGGAATLTAVVRKEGLDMPVVLQDLIDWLVPSSPGVSRAESLLPSNGGVPSINQYHSPTTCGAFP